MWMVGCDESYYPSISLFKTEEEARKQYNFLKSRLDKEAAVFIGKVDDYHIGSEYDLEYEMQD